MTLEYETLLNERIWRGEKSVDLVMLANTHSPGERGDVSRRLGLGDWQIRCGWNLILGHKLFV